MQETSINIKSIRQFLAGVTLFLGITAHQVSAQDISMEETLHYINGKLGRGYVIDVNRGIIIAKFSEGTEPFREDQVLYKALDLNSMHYDNSHKLFIINCKDQKDCVDRQLFVKKIQRDYGRLSLPVNLDPKGVEGMKKAFRHMIRLIEDPKYKSAEPFEP